MQIDAILNYVMWQSKSFCILDMVTAEIYFDDNKTNKNWVSNSIVLMKTSILILLLMFFVRIRFLKFEEKNIGQNKLFKLCIFCVLVRLLTEK